MKSKVILPKVLLLTLLIVLSTAFLFKFTTDAGSLKAVYVYLSRIEGDLDGTSGQEVEIILAIAPTQTIPTGGTVTIEFPDADDGDWCRAVGSLTATGVSSSTADLASTNWDIDSALPGTLTGQCNPGSGIGSVDTITISGVTALTGGTTYGVKIVSATGKIGTGATGEHEVNITAKNGTTIDSKTFKISIVADDSVIVTATVSEAPAVTCTINASTVNLGTLYPGGSFATGSHTIGTSSSGAAAGYYWAAYGTGNGTDAGLWKSGDPTKLLQSGPSATIDLTDPGTEGFGITFSDPDAAGSAVVVTDFRNTTPGVFGTLDAGIGGAKLVLYQNGAQGSVESSTVTYGARAGASAPAGSYVETVTLVCGGYF